MPSDDRARAALAALAGPVQAFRSTLGRTADDVAQLLRVRGGTREARGARFAAELGPFARGRIAVDRFTAAFADQPGVNGAGTEAVRRAHKALTELLARGDALLTAAVAPGGTLRDTVAQRLADVGRAFGAARIARDARGPARTDRHAAALERFPFAQWNRSERRLAPPLVIEVQGADFLPASLVEFLDGRIKLVLVVTGECAPAPLVRLISPSTYVQQAVAPTDLAGLAAWDGPGIAALVPDSAARFVHQPAQAGAHVSVDHLPSEPPRKAIDGISVAQQAEELAMLASLARSAPVEAGDRPAPPPGDPAQQIAAWLLAQVDLGNGA